MFWGSCVGSSVEHSLVYSRQWAWREPGCQLKLGGFFSKVPSSLIWWSFSTGLLPGFLFSRFYQQLSRLAISSALPCAWYKQEHKPCCLCSFSSSSWSNTILIVSLTDSSFLSVLNCYGVSPCNCFGFVNSQSNEVPQNIYTHKKTPNTAH